MVTLHHNGERWYVNRQSLVTRLRRWLVWFGGWEHGVGDCRHVWRFRIDLWQSYSEPQRAQLRALAAPAPAR